MPSFAIDQVAVLAKGLRAFPSVEEGALDADDRGLRGQVLRGDVDVVQSFKDMARTVDATRIDPGVLQTLFSFKTSLEAATFFIGARHAQVEVTFGPAKGAVVAAGLGGFKREFQRGSIYWHAQTGAHALHGPILVRWRELGAETGFLGYPMTEVMPGRDLRSEGMFVHFSGGSIYWSPVQPVPAVIKDFQLFQGLDTVVAGAASKPVTVPVGAGAAAGQPVGPIAGPKKTVATGTLNPAATAAIGELIGKFYWSLASGAGAFEVHGAIREKYLAMGAEASLLGYPRTDESGTPDGIGRFNHFQGGSIYWSPATSAHEVHGLIRDKWASLGWERNAALGYPITDELIPDRRAGFRWPETFKKPIAELAIGVVKVPAEAADAGIPRRAVNVAAEANRQLGPAAGGKVLAGGAVAGGTVAGTFKPGIEAGRPFDPGIGEVRIPDGVPSVMLPPVERSRNRFSDFENGVLYWARGQTSARVLAPVTKVADGVVTAISGVDVANLMFAKLGNAAFEGPNVSAGAPTFIGTTPCSFDGAQTRNRRHRIRMSFLGTENKPFGPFNTPLASPITATAEIRVEVAFDRASRRILLTPIDWSMPASSSSSYAAVVAGVLHAALDPVLWRPYTLLTVPKMDGDDPVAVLSVKTLADGRVGVFVEPRDFIFAGGLVVTQPFEGINIVGGGKP